MSTAVAQSVVPVDITVNGVEHHAEVEPRQLLVHFLRETLGLTGTHVGCDTSSCGACTVHLNGEAVKSCTSSPLRRTARRSPLSKGSAPRSTCIRSRKASGRSMVCSAGIAHRHDHGRRRASWRPIPTRPRVRSGIALEGNLCRCTGYQNIVKAIQYAAKTADSTADHAPMRSRRRRRAPAGRYLTRRSKDGCIRRRARKDGRQSDQAARGSTSDLRGRAVHRRSAPAGDAAYRVGALATRPCEDQAIDSEPQRWQCLVSSPPIPAMTSWT